MTEDRLREILADILGIPPESISDATSVETVNGFDSLTVMRLVMAVEEHVDFQFSDDEIATLTSWPNIKAAIKAHESGTVQAFYKALVLDADNTLWDGIWSEGGGAVTTPYYLAQEAFLALQQRGVILCMASKNEPNEIGVAMDRAAMVLHDEHFTVIQGGWGNKVASLRDIAKKLNIGLDAMVFVDDSPFEVEYVRSHLPEVKVVQVPKNLADYPRVAQEVAALFPTLVDSSKTEEYRALAAAERTRPQFTSETEYLSSLEIEVEIHLNRTDEIPRIAELCQKVNQFNLTTVRHTEADIAEIMQYGHVYSLSVKDKFGDQGLCGVLIFVEPAVENFMLSCRVLGRGIEYSPWQALHLGYVTAQYIPTPKNEQVRTFWGRVGLTPDNILGGPTNYQGRATVECPSWIKVTYA
jgi:FkbH-like protein